MTPAHAVTVLLIGVGIGFLSGLFGKGGAAVATPLLHAAGVPAMLAVGSPLPAALPATLLASSAYRRRGFFDRSLVITSIAVGVPATVAGAIATRWVGGGALILLTEVLIVLLGVRLLLVPRDHVAEEDVPARPDRLLVAIVAVIVGFVSGMLANSGGFLLAPLYVIVLHLPIKRAFAASLSVSAILTIPATLVHVALGHIDWTVTLLFALGATPLSLIGARVALRTHSARLERIYGAGIAVLGGVLLVAVR
jgi:hypothetical protein